MSKQVGIVLCLLPVIGILLYIGGLHSDKMKSTFLICQNKENADPALTDLSYEDKTNVHTNSKASISSSNDNKFQHNNRIPDGCSLVLADSSIEGAGWGVFTLKALSKGDAVHEGDPVIQIPDPNPQHAHGMRRILWDYLWDAQETGGQYEGQRVMSVIPGIGMLANGEFNMHNVLPYKPEIDDAGITRSQSPGAGAFTHYQNFTWYSQEDINEGSELFVNYGENWFRERGYLNQPPPSQKRSLPWLLENGYCIDNLVPGRSNIAHAGRGAFAVRDLEEGSIVAPVPVLPLTSASLGMIKQHESGRLIYSEQLLRNYCFGHKNSSLLLFPYSPTVNLINHDSQPNVKLMWSEASIPLFSKPMATLQESSSRLLLQLVALRPISEGDEILLDYGSEWVEAWKSHSDDWRKNHPLSRRQAEEQHVSSQTMDKVMRVLLTEGEQRAHPYPENLFTSCYYDYTSLQANEVEGSSTSGIPKTFRWRRTPGLFESRKLRPCSVLQRDQDASGQYFYTVRILNRPGLAPAERIPKGVPHIVTDVPREAIQFSDKLYTTDQHLETAFRKEIGLDIFPSQWMDRL